MTRERLSFTARQDARVFAVASDETIAALRERGVSLTVLASPALDGYRTPTQINAALTALVQPGASLETLGTSVNGVPIVALRIGNGPRHVRVLGGHHGDERPAVEFPMDWVAALLQRRSDDSAFAAQLAGLTLLVAPQVNPDGVTLGQRYNAHDVDLNRNYAYEFATDEVQAGAEAFSEPESRAVALDNEYHRYAISLTYHTGATNIGYPWNYTTAPFAAEAQLAADSQHYAALIGGAFYSIRGADWYISHGDTNDYSWGYYGGFDLTVELTGPTKTPDYSEVAGIEAPHMLAAYDWLTHAQDTALVHVTDASDGSALAAAVSGEGVSTWSLVLDGMAQLQTSGGSTLTISKPGYADAIITVGGEQSEVALAPRSVWTALPAPNEFAQGDALVFSLADAVAVHAYKPGAADIDFTCANATCSAPALVQRRPGLYDCAITGADAVVHPLRNCLLVHENVAVDLSTQAGATVIFSGIWGGATAEVQSGVPAPDNGVLAWASHGILYTQNTLVEPPPPLVTPTTPVTPSSPGVTKTITSAHHGCASTSSESALALASLLMILWRRRHVQR